MRPQKGVTRGAPVSQVIVVGPFWLNDQMVSTTGLGEAVIEAGML